MGNFLTVDQIRQMSETNYEELLTLYRNGYRLTEINQPNQPVNVQMRPPIVSSLATCSSSVQRGTTKTITTTVTTDGTPPYTLHFYVDTFEQTVSPTWDAVNKKFTFTWPFNENAGNHTYGTKITDSCASGSLSSNTDQCTVNVTVPCVMPTCNFQLS